MTETTRITKYLAECGECARRGAEDLIREGKVRINGIVVKEMNAQVVPGRDNVQVGNRSVRPAEKGMMLFHKPRSVVCTLSDPEGRKCVADYLTKQYQTYFPVGRLDYDSSGLLILTNDGELANRLMHPRYGFERTYEVIVKGVVTEKELRRLLSGVKLEDGFVKAIRASIKNFDDGQTELLFVVGEGKNRMVRRMFDSVGHPVVKLKRIKHGPLSLGTITGGQLKKLTQTEFVKMRKLIFADQKKLAEDVKIAEVAAKKDRYQQQVLKKSKLKRRVRD